MSPSPPISLDDFRRERDDERGHPEARRERQPERLRAQAVRDPLLAGTRRPADLGGRAVLEEVEEPEQAREHERRDPERGQLRPAEMADDRRVDEDVGRLRRERPERRHREPEDLAVVLGAEPQTASADSYAAR